LRFRKSTGPSRDDSIFHPTLSNRAHAPHPLHQKLRRQKIKLMQVHNLVDWQTHLASLRKRKDAGRVK
jgi:hypothetical protein